MSPMIVSALTWILPLIIAIVCHEVAHGWVANHFGDHTARDMGRLSLNPIRHVDPIGTVVLPLGLALAGAPIFGWARPVPVVQERLKDPRYDMILVALAGPLTNVALGLISAILLRLTGATGLLATMLQGSIAVNAFLAVFNLMPLPPFDGSKVLGGLLPGTLGTWFRGLDRFGFLFLILLLLVLPRIVPSLDLIGMFVVPPVKTLLGWYASVAGAGLGGV